MIILISDCWDIRKNNIVHLIDNWGKVFSVEFAIKVTKLPPSTWTNVFHFTADGDNENYGDRIPALYIENHNQKGYFQFCSAINDEKNYAVKHELYLGKKYQIIIKQYEVMEKYFYEIMIDDVSVFIKENTKPTFFADVTLYASDPWVEGFSSEFGHACDFNIVGAP